MKNQESIFMLKGIILLSVTLPSKGDSGDSGAAQPANEGFLPKWKILSKYVPESGDSPSTETIEEILIRYYSEGDTLTLNLRLPPFKYYVVPVTEAKDVLLMYILDVAESLEIVQIFPEETAKMISDNLKSASNLKTIMEGLFDSRNRLLGKLESVQVLTEEIGAFANKLIDAGKFDDAQGLIKLAKTVPDKMIAAYAKAKQEGRERNYRAARKSLSECLNLAQKIEDSDLEAYLDRKIDVYTQIPQYEKELKSLINSFTKELSKSIDLPSYQRQVYRLDKAIDLLDNLEEDEMMEKMVDLSNTLVLAGKLVFDLKSLDRKIKSIISNL